MKLRFILTILLGAALLSAALPAAAKKHYGDRKQSRAFIQMMVSKHGFKADEVRNTLNEAKKNGDVLDAMDRPAEAMPWYRYRAIFMNQERIDAGAQFLRDNRKMLQAAETKYGVPAEVIVAIIGVETRYGQRMGDFRVLDALATLSFDYPKRGDFFKSELEQFLLMCREEKLDPAVPTGSYAGAMGLPQFMPSSYRHYAVDFNGDGHRDLWHEPDDVIGSIANYLGSRGWQRGQEIAAQVTGNPDKADNFESSRLEPLNRFGELVKAGVRTELKAETDAPAGILELEGKDDPEYWVALRNFFVITTYNRSPLYAMAVFQLGHAIRAADLAN